jgi:sRNA-binding carbon storage regulator CsrA
MVGGAGGFDRLLKITVLEVAGCRVKLGFEVDADIPVHRLEIWERMRASVEENGGGGESSVTSGPMKK